MMVGRSLMLMTALSPVIGFDKASATAHKSNDEGLPGHSGRAPCARWATDPR
jgi:fumarate hydratase class II